MRSTHPSLKLFNLCGTTNITTSAYLQLATIGASLGQESGFIHAYNGSTSVLKLAFGAAAAEVDFCYIYPGINRIQAITPKNSRISVKAVDANASAGTLALDFYI